MKNKIKKRNWLQRLFYTKRNIYTVKSIVKNINTSQYRVGETIYIKS